MQWFRKRPTFEKPDDLSLVLGGPLYDSYLRCHLARPPIEWWQRRIFFFLMITWVPSAILATMEGLALGRVHVPFFLDAAAQTRLLIGLPLLILAEVPAHHRITWIVRLFNEYGLVAPEEKGRYENVVASAVRLRNSPIAEAVLLILSFTLGHWLWLITTLRSDTWYAPIQSGRYSSAGYWYGFVCLPIVRFLLLRWYFRIFVWYRFLWQISRMRLRFNVLHPDRAGGLGFLSISPFAFLLVLIAQISVFSGSIANNLLHENALLSNFKNDAITVVAFSVFLVYFPLTFFTMPLYRARLNGMREMQRFSMKYVSDFRNKWLQKTTPHDPQLSALGSSDIQSLADLDNSFRVVQEMNFWPFQFKSTLKLAILLLIPLFPLLLLEIPVEQILLRLLKFVT